MFMFLYYTVFMKVSDDFTKGKYFRFHSSLLSFICSVPLMSKLYTYTNCTFTLSFCYQLVEHGNLVV